MSLTMMKKMLYILATLGSAASIYFQYNYTLFFNKNVVFPAQAEYSYSSADFRLKIFLYYS